MKLKKIVLSCLIAGIVFILGIKPALAFCGFYVAKFDTSLYNQASQVIIARDGKRTVLTMSNDYQGDVEDFAMVVPVPIVLTQEQVHINDSKIIDRLDSFSAPRLVEYFDRDPCLERRRRRGRSRGVALESSIAPQASNTLGVTIEEQFSVGEYDILILSAEESDGLKTWLTQNGYQLPEDAEKLLQPYIRQKMKFFVAKVNLEEFDRHAFEKLRPISIAYESPKFMLPIRLGMSNAKGEQDLIVYLLSPKGQVELTNYRTVKIPSNVNVPEFVENEFTDFYQATFETAYEKENKQVAFLEYAWDMGQCDPCAADLLDREELKQAGVFWLKRNSNNRFGGHNVFITRLHVRYTRNKFPEDLVFQETSNKQFFQGRYVINHPYTGEMDCDAAQQYQQQVSERKEKEAQTLANLTSWDINEIRDEINKPIPWWRDVWK